MPGTRRIYQGAKATCRRVNGWWSCRI